MVSVEKVGSNVRVSREVLLDTPEIGDQLNRTLFEFVDRKVRPWAYPDPPAVPFMRLFTGRLGRLLDWLERQ